MAASSALDSTLAFFDCFTPTILIDIKFRSFSLYRSITNFKNAYSFLGWIDLCDSRSILRLNHPFWIRWTAVDDGGDAR